MSKLKKRVARDRGGISDLCAADLDRQAAPCRSLIGRQGGIALNDGYGCEGRIEFVGYDLGQGRLHACAKIDLAGVNGDHAFCIDGEECVDLVQRERLAGCRRGLRKRRRGQAKPGKAHNKNAAFERLAAGSKKSRAHVRLLALAVDDIAFDARNTARTIRAWVPQRQRLLASAVFTAVSSGVPFVARNAADSMIMPLMQ